MCCYYKCYTDTNLCGSSRTEVRENINNNIKIKEKQKKN